MAKYTKTQAFYTTMGPPPLLWIRDERPKWKPLHERIVDELINGKENDQECVVV